MPIDLVCIVAALAFGAIAWGWLFEGKEARKQQRALEADNREHEHWGIPAELRTRRSAQPKGKRGKVA